MAKSFSPRRLVENEVYFRQKNRSIETNLKKLKKMAKEEGQEHLFEELDDELAFYCECSDENCRERIVMKREEYDSIHKENDRFIVLPGHELISLEDIAESSEKYNVVIKKIDPPNSVSKLNITPVTNV